MTVWIDTHCHLDAAEFLPDAQQVRRQAAINNVAHCVLPAVEVANFDTVRLQAHAQGDSYALGIHPLCTGRAADADLAVLDAHLAQHYQDPRLVAVGEIGLDYFVAGLDGLRQEYFYRAQLKLARKYGLPVMLHVRRSADKLLKHLREVGQDGAGWRGTAHAFNGSQQQADAFLAMGFKLGFGGATTFPRALQLRRLAATLPLSALVLETDAPDIPPQWLYQTAQQRTDGAPQGRNSPAELPRIGAEIAVLRGISADVLAAATTLNAVAAFPKIAALL